MKKIGIITIGFCVIIVGLFFFYVNLYEVENFDLALSGYLTFSSISIGIFATCIPILATLITTPLVMEILKDTIFSKELIWTFILTAFFGLSSIVLTIIFQILFANDSTQLSIFKKLISSMWVGFSLVYVIFVIIFYALIAGVFFKSQNREANKEIIKPIPNKSLFKK